MQIPVSIVSYMGKAVNLVVYDSTENIFKDVPFKQINRVLPIQDYISCDLSSNNIATVVGKIYSSNDYVVSFGDNFLYFLNRQSLLRYKLSNMILTKDNRLKCIDGKLPDLSSLFPDKGIRFSGFSQEIQASSLGVAKKFYAKYKGRSCVVKFSKLSSNEDIYNEILYKKISRFVRDILLFCV